MSIKSGLDTITTLCIVSGTLSGSHCAGDQSAFACCRFRKRHDAAVTAAAAARRWRDYQSNKRRGSQLSLPSVDDR